MQALRAWVVLVEQVAVAEVLQLSWALFWLSFRVVCEPHASLASPEVVRLRSLEEGLQEVPQWPIYLL